MSEEKVNSRMLSVQHAFSAFFMFCIMCSLALETKNYYFQRTNKHTHSTGVVLHTR